MFVTRSNYEKLNRELLQWKSAFITERTERNEITVEYNELMTRFNALKGLDNKSSLQLEEADIKRLITLCHPDKHGGKQSAVEITQKLLSMRK